MKFINPLNEPLPQVTLVSPGVSDVVRGLLLQLVGHRQAPPKRHTAHVHTGRTQQPLLLPAGAIIMERLGVVEKWPLFILIQKLPGPAEWQSEDGGWLCLQRRSRHLHRIQTPPRVQPAHQPLRLAGSECFCCLRTGCTVFALAIIGSDRTRCLYVCCQAYATVVTSEEGNDTDSCEKVDKIKQYLFMAFLCF